MPKFLIIDDHPIVRKGIHQMLDELPGQNLVEEASSAGDGLKAFNEVIHDLVLLDINLPGRGGLDLIKDLKKICPGVKILIVSMYPEEQYAIRALKSGAMGYLTKSSAPDELLMAVTRILKGDRYITQSIAEKIFDEFEQKCMPHETLSNREFEVMKMIAGGRSLKEISNLLSLSEKTVSTYRTRILDKMDMHTNADLIRYALQNKLIE
jgi:two-component system invasion response regulator UvrY